MDRAPGEVQSLHSSAFAKLANVVPRDGLVIAARALPAMAVVRHKDGSTHFVVVWWHPGNWRQLMDPSVGRRWVPVHRFAQELCRHQPLVPASGWRDWAASTNFERPLCWPVAPAGAGTCC